MTVFRLYCIRGRSISEVAGDLECSRTTVFRRLQAIRAATGVEPEALRRFSPHFAKIEAQISDPRAKHIYRKNLIDDEDPGETRE
jgi:hypothetical protein